MFTRLNLFFLLGTFIALTTFLYPQDFLTRIYTVEDGLPDGQVFDVLQDSSGLMWFATRSGVCTYNGQEWKTFEQYNNAVSYVRLKLDKSNRVWALPYLSYDSIRVFIKDKQVKSYPPIYSEVGERRVTCYTFDLLDRENSKMIIVGTLGSGIHYFAGSEWKHISVKEGLNSDYVTKVLTVNNNIYISTFKGVYKFDKNLMNGDFSLIEGLPNARVLEMSIDTSNSSDAKIWLYGVYWIGYLSADDAFHLVSGKLKYLWSGKKKFSYLTFAPNHHRIYYGNGIGSFFVDIDYSNGKFILKNNDYSKPTANSVVFDYEGNQWIATARGVLKKSKVDFINYNKKNGLLEDEATLVSQMSDGTIVIGHNIGITLLKGNSKEYIRIPGATENTGILTRLLAVCRLDSSTFLLVSYKNGILKLKNGKPVKWYRTSDNVRYLSVIKTFENHILVGTDFGVYELKNNSLTPVYRDIIPGNLIRRIYQTSDSTLLFGRFKGLISIKGNKYRKYNADNFDGDNIFSIYEKKDLGVLIGTMDGLYIMGKTKLERFSKNGFSLDRPVYFITEDNEGNLWFGTDKGVFGWDGTNVKHFTTADGLSGNETNRAAGFVDKDGYLWIGTESGLSKFIGNKKMESTIKPKVEFRFISDSENNIYPLTEMLHLSGEMSEYQFHYQGYSFYDENRNLYEVELDNLEANKKEVIRTKDNFITYRSLSPGIYRFSVRFRNAKGVWSDKIIGANFTVSKPFYYQIYFYFGLVFIVSILVLLIQNEFSQLRTKRQLEKRIIRTSAVLETTENERRRITRDLHDGLGQLLASAKMKVELIKRSRRIEGDELDDAAALILQARKEMSKIIHDLHPTELDKYGLATAIKKMCEEISKKTSININCDLSSYSKIKKKNFEIMIYRIIQEAVSNIIKHADASNVQIKAVKSESMLEISIVDDGKGFEFSGIDNLDEKGMGLLNMYERTNILGGKFTIKTAINKGTAINIKIPV